MASNNYAEVITDQPEAQRIFAHFESMAARGCSFTVMEFDPAVDRFVISCRRESNFPTLPDLEVSGTMMSSAAVAALWNANASTLNSIDFGNGYLGLFYESEGRCYIAIPYREL